MLSGRTNINNRFSRYYMNGGHKKRGRILYKEPCPIRVDDRVRTGDPQNHNLML